MCISSSSFFSERILLCYSIFELLVKYVSLLVALMQGGLCDSTFVTVTVITEQHPHQSTRDNIAKLKCCQHRDKLVVSNVVFSIAVGCMIYLF